MPSRSAPIALWRVSFDAPPAAAETLAELLGAQALAQSLAIPPRRPTASVELLFDREPDAATLTAQMAVLATMIAIDPPPLAIAPVPKLDWLRKVAQDFPPLRIARWTVHGAQHRDKVPDRRFALQIDATSAFGTGEHPTTQSCLRLLDAILRHAPHDAAKGRYRRMLDIGCGSGILALAFAQATRGHAVAVDLDPDAVAIAAGNARVNGLRRHVQTGWSNGYRARLVGNNAPYDLIMANIFAGPLSRLAKDLKRHLRPGGTAILSGILQHQANRVLAAHRMQGLYLRRHLRVGEWSALALTRPNRAK